MTFIPMMAFNLTTNLVRTMTRAVMRKLSKRRKRLKQGRELSQGRQRPSLLQKKKMKERKEKATKRNYRLYKQTIYSLSSICVCCLY